MAERPFEFTLETPDLRSFMARVREFSPKLATEVRRELRRSGDSIIAAQRAILAGPTPGPIRKVGSEYRLVIPKGGRKPYLAKRNVYETGEGRASGGTGMRDQIAAALSTRVATGKTRQGVQVRTSRSRAPMSVTWQARVFRARNFGRDDRHDQQGQPYFFEPIRVGQEAARNRINEVLADALEQLAK